MANDNAVVNLQDLGQFTGTAQWHKWSSLFSSMTCTDGVKYLADNAQAYWLLDAIASYQIGEVVRRSENLQDFQVWQLVLKGCGATLSCSEDSPENPVIVQEIEYTDFPLESIKLYCINNVILLPSEY